tara:strand:- start:2347 stop:2805 length:459 start_codon:yes stop_codon:yes gene_type:complete
MIQNNRYYWSHFKMQNVTVSVKPKQKTQGVVFRVINMIDIGNGRQTVVLESVDYPEPSAAKSSNDGFTVPFRMGELDFVYASRQNPSLCDYRHLISCVYPDAKIEEIVPEVLAPGDLLVFKQNKADGSIKMAGAMRVVCPKSSFVKRAGYAL